MGAWNRVFAVAYDPFLWWGERRGMAGLRRELLGRAQGEVLEIGAGTGLNLSHYGARTAEIALVEPDVLLHARLRRRLKDSGLRGRVVEAGAEALPFPDNSFDTVVSTLVLCTVPDPAAALAEIVRVLRPGGQMLFIEHVRAEEGSRLERWQERLGGPWHAFACGCNAGRDTGRLLADSELEIAKCSNDRWVGMPLIVRPLIRGVAILPL